MRLNPRQAFAAFRLTWFGRIAPRDICRAFGVARATAAADVASLRACFPSARIDPERRATTANAHERQKAGQGIAVEARDALDLLLAQDRLQRAAGAPGPWTTARIIDRRPAARPIAEEIAMQALTALEDGAHIALDGPRPRTLVPTALVRTHDGYHLTGFDARTGAALEIDLAEVAPGWRLPTAPNAPGPNVVRLYAGAPPLDGAITLPAASSPTAAVWQLLTPPGERAAHAA